MNQNLSKIINHYMIDSGRKIPIGKDDIVYVSDNSSQLESKGKVYNIFLEGYSHIKKAKDENKRKQLEKSGDNYTVLDWCEVEPNADILIPGIKITGIKKLEGSILKEDGLNPYSTGIRYLSFLTLLTDWKIEPFSILEYEANLKKSCDKYDPHKYDDKSYIGVESLVLENDDPKYMGLKINFSKAFEMELKENNDLCLELLTSKGFKRIPVDYNFLDNALKNKFQVGLDKNIAPNVGYNIYNRMKQDTDVNPKDLANFMSLIDKQFMLNPNFVMRKMLGGMVRSIRNVLDIKQRLNYFSRKR
ncbi:MAG: hypothetical protein KAI26_07665 [Nanoarchaeota archaeon]|nr:hypothetical protein [Nanoarchaeota archaeon]